MNIRRTSAVVEPSVGSSISVAPADPERSADRGLDFENTKVDLLLRRFHGGTVMAATNNPMSQCCHRSSASFRSR